MNLLDVVIVIPIILGAIGGYRKGFLLEIVNVLALILAIIGGFKLMHWGMSILMSEFDLSGKWLPYLSFLLIFVVIIIAVNILGKVLKKIIDLTLLGSVDNLFGALVGMLKWAFLISVVFWIMLSLDLDWYNTQREGSYLYTTIAPLAPWLIEKFSFIIPFAHDLFDNIRDLVPVDPGS